jgi:type II secretory pathway component PulL
MRIGFIDWQDSKISLYVFEKKAGNINFVKSMDISSENSLDSSSLSPVIETGIENFFLGVPLSSLTLREQNFPFSDKRKISETLPYELEGILLGSVSDYIIDYIVLKSSDSGSEVLAVCLEKLKLQEILDRLSSSSIEPRVVTSLDLRLSGVNSDKLIQTETFNDDVRVEAALKELTDPTVNLRQHELAYQGDIEKLRKNLRLTSVLVLIILIIFAAGSIIKSLSLQKEHENLQNSLNAAYRQIFPEDRRVVDVDRQFTGKINELIRKKTALGGIPLLETLREIASRNSKNVTLSEFSADGKGIFIRGTAESFQDVESLKTNYSHTFGGVKVMNSDTTSDNKINFTIVMQDKTP